MGLNPNRPYYRLDRPTTQNRQVIDTPLIGRETHRQSPDWAGLVANATSGKPGTIAKSNEYCHG